jgi:hypothetical protein
VPVNALSYSDRPRPRDDRAGGSVPDSALPPRSIITHSEKPIDALKLVQFTAALQAAGSVPVS